MKSKPRSKEYVPRGSRLVFIKQTVFGWRKRSTQERVYSRGRYRCKCGNEKECNITEVKRGKIKSCGCLKENQRASVTKHGIWNSPIYNVWMDIKNRCYKKRHKAYKWYGGSGVRMCKEWRNSVLAFRDWAVSNGWRQGLHVDKDIKPTKLGLKPKLYSPEYCSIVTPKENCGFRKQKTVA